jgi:hypothetical protein
MNDRSRDPAAAGALLIGSIVVCGGVGFALGSLVGVAGLAAGLGGFAGLILGFALVYTRFKDL